MTNGTILWEDRLFRHAVFKRGTLLVLPCCSNGIIRDHLAVNNTSASSHELSYLLALVHRHNCVSTLGRIVQRAHMYWLWPDKEVYSKSDAGDAGEI